MSVSLQFVFPRRDTDEVSEGLRRITKALSEGGLADGSARGFLGGEFGYGADFENETFLLHHYCWCESEDCLWCGGSGCQDRGEDPRHSGCYQSRLEALRQKYGTREEWGWHVKWGHPGYEADKRALCAEMGLDFERGNEAHCTCGATAACRKRYDECQCDWHTGRGVFRFGAAVSAPNLWHKPTGLQITWYKYIGRDMEAMGGDATPWDAIELDCLSSLRRPA